MLGVSHRKFRITGEVNIALQKADLDAAIKAHRVAAKE
jgi:hypothetical protein